MTKKNLISNCAAVTGFTKKDTEQVVDAVFESIASALAMGEDVSIVGFGKFSVVTRAARDGRNPLTGEPLKIDESKAPKFKASDALKAAVKGE